ncbi:hypothetical protein [Parasphingorhabdus cellanae]|uniref:Uncharacterized protein n=1 Tax=Parasphingorhabdus cellanae TaxID=2806553 RepID=A0ABX7T4R1_9SPHN|nr:hypothetical protein [Parasphingorhabdus cellanae]QTD55245.1 hypothetical protein J4G78_13590 [Parasphingorhabdus cellanae]QTD57057.1 hypothetical protein J4G78_05720 [Parasphingorhabdus cellanae]
MTSSPHIPSEQDLPEPTLRPQHNGWSKPKMRSFLEALAASGSVTTAAKSVYMTRDSAYKLRARLAGTPFDLAWEAALENALRQITHEAVDRAINGVAQPIFWKGEQIGEKRVFNENLTKFLIANPSRIGRNPMAREFALTKWDSILDRVEHGPLDWNEKEREEDPEGAKIARDYIKQHSEYAAGWMWELSEDKPRKTG